MDASLPVRERLMEHRANRPAQLPDVMDPIGFSLEHAMQWADGASEREPGSWMPPVVSRWQHLHRVEGWRRCGGSTWCLSGPWFKL